MKFCLSWSRCTRMASILSAALAGLLAISLPVLASPPSEPGLPIGEISGGAVNLSWAASTDDVSVAGYNVYQNDSYVATVSANSYSGQADTSQTNNFYVVAFDTPADGAARMFSGRSPTLTLLPDDKPGGNGSNPTAPTGLSAQRTSPTTVTLTWTPSTDDMQVEGYNVYRDNQYISTVQSPGFDDTELAPDVEYTYYVIAFDETRNFSDRSAQASTSGEPPDDNPPPAGTDTEKPAVVTGLQGSASAAGVALTWTAGTDNVGVDGYNVYRDQSYLETVFTNAYLDTSPPDTESVEYSVTAFDVARNFSVNSASLSVLLGDNPDDPKDPEEPPEDPDNPNDDNKGTPPELRDPDADAIPSPPASDPFGSLLEIDEEASVAGGPPTQPKNLRAELVSNDWAEINWAPANDDGFVVEYRIYRSDGVEYSIRQDTIDPNSGAQAEIDRYWNSTLFMDCNFTRFDTRVHNCRDNAPKPGDEFVYEVTAIDDEGQESARSEPLEIIYHISENAPIPYYDDFYKLPDDQTTR